MGDATIQSGRVMLAVWVVVGPQAACHVSRTRSPGKPLCRAPPRLSEVVARDTQLRYVPIPGRHH